MTNAKRMMLQEPREPIPYRVVGLRPNSVNLETYKTVDTYFGAKLEMIFAREAGWTDLRVIMGA